MVRKLKVFDTIDSTNNYLKENLEKLEDYTIVRANFQTAGRGQFDRSWQSNKGENLLFSILFKKNLGFPSRYMNPIIVTALLSTLKTFGIDAHYKEPNDIYVGDKKLAGILIETKYDRDHLNYLILGVGMNINQVDFPHLMATSMRKETGETYMLEAVLDELLNYLEHNLQIGRMIYETT